MNDSNVEALRHRHSQAIERLHAAQEIRVTFTPREREQQEAIAVAHSVPGISIGPGGLRRYGSVWLTFEDHQVFPFLQDTMGQPNEPVTVNLHGVIEFEGHVTSLKGAPSPLRPRCEICVTGGMRYLDTAESRE